MQKGRIYTGNIHMYKHITKKCSLIEKSQNMTLKIFVSVRSILTR